MKKDLIKKLYPYIIPYKGKIFGTVLFSFAPALIGGAQVRLVRPIFDQGLNPSATKEEIIILAGMLLGLGLLHFPCRFLHFYWLRFIVDRAVCTVREELFYKTQKLPTSFFSKSKQHKRTPQKNEPIF